ncbi:MAG TPA: hypothetical protein VFI91_01295 [Longimicrobiaceae bacterium]|nr:hypothetical protein [Longimicrobiaceae bacterium]
MINKRVTVGSIALLMALGACGDSEEPGVLDRVAEAKNVATAYSGMIDAAQQAAEDAEAGVTIEPVDFRTLRDLFPEEISGLPRVELEGQKSGMMGFTMSTASATYREDATEGPGYLRAIETTITDLGGVRGMAMMGLAPWMAAEIDRETSDSYERTFEYKGYPAHEEFSGVGQARENMAGTIQLLVGERFLVKVSGNNIEDARIKQALDGLDLDALEAMKDVGVTQAQ